MGHFLDVGAFLNEARSTPRLRTDIVSSTRYFRKVPIGDMPRRQRPILANLPSRKSSMRAYVFRFAPGSGHRAMQSACPFRANTRHEDNVAP